MLKILDIQDIVEFLTPPKLGLLLVCFRLSEVGRLLGGGEEELHPGRSGSQAQL